MPNQPPTSNTLYPEAQERFGTDLESVGFNRIEHPHGKWEGDVDVSWTNQETGQKNTSIHRVAITLDSGFPFKKPEVTPVSALAGSLRHRAPVGSRDSLCLFSERRNGWMPSITASDLLDRIREWFVHYHLDDWGDADRPPDLHLYYRRQQRGYLAVFGKDWNPPDGETGRFAIAEGHRAFLVSNPTQGIMMPKQPSVDAIRESLGVSSASGVGVWFRLQEEPTPGESLSELLNDIDAKTGQKIGTAKRAIRDLVGYKLRRECRTMLALGYPSVGEHEEWLFIDFILPKGKTRATQWERRLDETRVRALEAAPASPQALLRRTVHTQSQLRGKSVLIFGLGALGSTIAMLLAKAGLPKLTGVDNDQLRPSNCVRHEASIRLSGYPKGLAMKVQIAQHVPYCEYEALVETWNPEELRGLVRTADIVIDATANEPFSLLLNEVCVRGKVPLLCVGAHLRASVGRIRAVFPGRSACLVCYLSPDFPIIPAGDEGEFVEGGCGDPTVEASAIDLNLIATNVAKIARDILVGTSLPGSECLVVNSSIEGAGAPLDEPGLHWKVRNPVPRCGACGH